MKGYPLPMMLQNLEPEAESMARQILMTAARKNPVLRRGWFQAKRELDEQMADEVERWESMTDPEGRLLLDEVLDKEVGLGCDRSVYSEAWQLEWNPNDDLPF